LCSGCTMQSVQERVIAHTLKEEDNAKPDCVFLDTQKSLWCTKCFLSSRAS
jgi:hypothetical protein